MKQHERSETRKKCYMKESATPRKCNMKRVKCEK